MSFYDPDRHDTIDEGFAKSQFGKELYILVHDDGIDLVDSIRDFVPVQKHVWMIAREYWHEKLSPDVDTPNTPNI